MRVHIPFRLNPIASLAWLGKQLPCPLHVKGGGKSVKEVAVENPLSRGGHTHIHDGDIFNNMTGKQLKTTPRNLSKREADDDKVDKELQHSTQHPSNNTSWSASNLIPSTP